MRRVVSLNRRVPRGLVEGALGILLAFGALALVRLGPLAAAEEAIESGSGSGSEAGRADDAAPRDAAPSDDTDGSRPAADDEVVRYELEARLDTEAHRVEATGRITWRNTSRVAQEELWIHLYLNAFREGSIWTRERIAGFRGGGAPNPPGRIEVTRFEIEGMGERWPASPRTPGDATDATDIRVPLTRPVAPGETIAIDVAFTSTLPNVVMRTGFSGSFHMVAQWFPKLARLEPDGTWRHFPFHRLSEFYADFGGYDVTLDVPEGFVVGAVGQREETTARDGRLRHRYRADRVIDFAFTAWDGFAVEERQGPDGIALRCLYPAGRDDLARLELDEVEAALPRFSAAYGPYPYPTLTIVHPPDSAREAGGMEYPTLITTGGDDVLGVRAIAAVTVHELGHQWFHGLLASDEHRFPFLDEGLNTYATARVLEARYPGASAVDNRLFTIGQLELSRAAGSERWHADPVAQPAKAFRNGRDYGWLVYQRAAAIFETMRRIWGDEAMERALGRYARDHRFGHPSPDDLLAAVGAEMGDDAREILRRALFERGWVDYAIVSVDETRRDDGHAIQVVVRRRGDLELPVTITLRTRDGRRVERRWDGRGATHAVELTAEAPLESVSIDEEVAAFLDHDLRNNHHRVDRVVVAPRALALGGGLAALLVGLGAP